MRSFTILSKLSPVQYLWSDFDTCHQHINLENKIITCHTNKDDIDWTNCDMDIYI